MNNGQGDQPPLSGEQRRREQGYLYAATHTELPGSDDSWLHEDHVVEQNSGKASSAVIDSGATLEKMQTPAPAESSIGPQKVAVRAKARQPLEAQQPREEPTGDSEASAMDVTMSEVDPRNPMGSAGECFDESFPLQERAEHAQKILDAVDGIKAHWISKDKPPCPTCDRRHPPFCREEKIGQEFLAFKKKAVKLLKEQKRAEAPAPPPSKAGGKKKKSACTQCARWHPGGAEACRAPACEEPGCDLHHWESEDCDKAYARYVEQGLRKPKKEPAQPATLKPATPQGGIQDEDVQKLLAVMDFLTPEQLGKLAEQMAGSGKRKAEEAPEATAERPSKKAKAKVKAKAKANGKGKEKEKEEESKNPPSPRRQPDDKEGTYKGARNLEKGIYSHR